MKLWCLRREREREKERERERESERVRKLRLLTSWLLTFGASRCAFGISNILYAEQLFYQIFYYNSDNSNTILKKMKTETVRKMS